MKTRQPASEDFRNGNDTLNGTAGADFLIGGAGNDMLYGLAGNDRLKGGAGDEWLTGGAGNDIMLGEEGTDNAAFSGPMSAYAISDLGGGMLRVVGPDGDDVVSGIERLAFSDRTVTLPLALDLVAGGLALWRNSATFTITNLGTLAAGASAAGVYLSADATVTTADTLFIGLGTQALNGSVSQRLSFALPLAGTLAAGLYYMGVVADAGATVGEANEGNNLSNVVPLVLGDNNANELAGTAGDDAMFGLAGNDVLNGGSHRPRRQAKKTQRPTAKTERRTGARRPRGMPVVSRWVNRSGPIGRADRAGCHAAFIRA